MWELDERRLQGAVERAAEGCREAILRELAAPSSSAETDAGRRRSEPGEPPRTESGDLAASVKVRRRGALELEVAVEAEYASVLEYGGRFVAARPFLGPALESVAEEFFREVDAALVE